eukprot:CAMPEP_0114540480 /NCGR_PEP_ID=MMETSP0114-20121206/790_1 /TAXON_ID=31324 /ORGANISM="Goniomonas sp, Strain m" /LENGTH=56 /DNA_ID=CAMNT_0001724645 /DNA_START=6 /DNA_END=176 /DNA_ORIENTATION=+
MFATLVQVNAVFTQLAPSAEENGWLNISCKHSLTCPAIDSDTIAPRNFKYPAFAHS